MHADETFTGVAPYGQVQNVSPGLYEVSVQLPSSHHSCVFTRTLTIAPSALEVTAQLFDNGTMHTKVSTGAEYYITRVINSQYGSVEAFEVTTSFPHYPTDAHSLVFNCNSSSRYIVEVTEYNRLGTSIISRCSLNLTISAHISSHTYFYDLPPKNLENKNYFSFVLWMFSLLVDGARTSLVFAQLLLILVIAFIIVLLGKMCKMRYR